MIKKKIMITCLLFTAFFALTGCEMDMQIIEDKDAKYNLTAVEKDNLESNVYYVKEGTKFYEVYEPKMTTNNVGLSKKKAAWLIKDEGLIPTCYENEYLAQASSKVVLDKPLTLERYKDTGYSFGINSAQFKDGYIQFTSNNIIKDTSAYEEFQDASATNTGNSNIMIETIDGEYVTQDMVNEAGVIVRLEQDKEYTVTYYLGTYYKTATVKADVHFLQCFEVYSVNDREITKNGYIRINLPEYLKSGWYRLSNVGFFKYYDYKKGEESLTLTDMNEPYYLTEEEQITAYSQQFTFNLENNTDGLAVVAEYSAGSDDEASEITTSTDDSVIMMLTSPDGKVLTANATIADGKIECSMTSSSAGKWIVNIMPQSLNIKSVGIEPLEDTQEATKENFEIVTTEASTGITVAVSYRGEGNVRAQVIEEDGTSHDLSLDKNYKNNDEKRLTYTFSYMAAGTYKINVYHYPDTEILGVDKYLDEDVRQVDVISVEE